MKDGGTIVILIDALGHEIVERHGFRPSGLSKPARVETVLGFSQAALTTILTGLEPSRHGLWMMYSFAERHSPFSWLGLVPFSSERRILRNSIRLVLDRLYRIESYYSLYSIPRKVFPNLDLPARRIPRDFVCGGLRRAPHEPHDVVAATGQMRGQRPPNQSGSAADHDTQRTLCVGHLPHPR